MSDAGGSDAIELIGGDYPFFKDVTGARAGLNLLYNAVGPGEVFRAVLEDLPFQANEFSLANYAMMHDHGITRMTAIPIFLNRAFRHGLLHVRKDSDLTHPSQLRGKTIGAREYTQTAGVWWRGLILDEYGLHWSEMNWVSGSAQRFAPPPEARVRIVSGDLEQMLIDGDIDGYLSPSTKDRQKPAGERKLRSLFPDTEATERDYFRRTGIYPINHAIVIHRSCLAAHPHAPKAIFDACCASKKRFYTEGGNLDPWGDKRKEDPIPFGLTGRNREIVATLLRYLHEQKFIKRIPTVDELFVEDANRLADT